MSIRFRPRSRLMLGCVIVFGCFLAPSRYTSSLSLGWLSFSATVQKRLARAGRSLALTFDGLASWRRAARENRQLRNEVTKLRELLERERARSAEKDQRIEMLGQFVRYQHDLIAQEAEVIGEGAGAQRGLLFIDRGSRDKITRGMVAVAGHSVVGTVRAVGPSASSVSLVTSAGSAFDAQITTTGERGIVVGNGDGTMRMKYISKTKPERRTAVVSRGRDGMTPKHFLLGRVVSARRRPGSLTYDVILEPARELDRLPSVVVVRPAISALDFPPEGETGTGDDG